MGATRFRFDRFSLLSSIPAASTRTSAEVSGLPRISEEKLTQVPVCVSLIPRFRNRIRVLQDPSTVHKTDEAVAETGSIRQEAGNRCCANHFAASVPTCSSAPGSSNRCVACGTISRCFSQRRAASASRFSCNTERIEQQRGEAPRVELASHEHVARTQSAAAAAMCKDHQPAGGRPARRVRRARHANRSQRVHSAGAGPSDAPRCVLAAARGCARRLAGGVSSINSVWPKPFV